MSAVWLDDNGNVGPVDLDQDNASADPTRSPELHLRRDAPPAMGHAFDFPDVGPYVVVGFAVIHAVLGRTSWEPPVPCRVLRLAVLTTASAVVTTTLGLGTSVPAMADDSPAPVAGDDVVTVEARSAEFGGVTFIDVLANDSAAGGGVLEICRVQAPDRGLSVAEAQPDGGFTIDTPEAAYSSGVSGGSLEEGAREQLVVLSWANRAGTYQFTYWACDAEHLTPATVTVTVTRTPEVTVRKVDRPGKLRFTNPRTTRAVVIYGGLNQDRPDGRVRLAPGTHTTQRVERRAIRWIAISPRNGQPIGEGVVRGIRLPGSTSRSGEAADGIKPQLTPRMLRAWRSS